MLSLTSFSSIKVVGASENSFRGFSIFTEVCILELVILRLCDKMQNDNAGNEFRVIKEPAVVIIFKCISGNECLISFNVCSLIGKYSMF